MNNQNLGMGVAAEDPGIFARPRQAMGGEVVTGQTQGASGGSEQMQGREVGAELAGEQQILVNEAQRQVDAGVENAVGVATVGASEGGQGVATQVPQAIQEAQASVPEADGIKLERVPEEAKDGEKMEKIWMKRAQEVVAETRKDPNTRLVQVALLREEYMRKRFNRILGEHN